MTFDILHSFIKYVPEMKHFSAPWWMNKRTIWNESHKRDQQLKQQFIYFLKMVK